MKRLQLIRKTQLGFAAVLAVLLAVGVVSYRSLAASADTEQWVQHTHEVLEHLETLISEITNVQRGYRGFALSADEAFLQPSLANRSLVDQEEKTLRVLTADNPNQQRQLFILDGLTEQIVTQGDMTHSPAPVTRSRGGNPSHSTRKGREAPGRISYRHAPHEGRRTSFIVGT